MLATAPVALSGCGLLDSGVQKYDLLSQDDEICNQKWADYDAQLQRRADLIPNIVAVVKGSAAHEEDTLKAVTEARASATQIKLDAESLTDPAKVEAFKQAQAGLSGALSKLMSIQENYPQLQANAAFHDLMVEMEGTENRILQARRDYNTAVGAFNFELRRVSGKVMNPLTGHEFKPRVYFTADESAKVAPKVDFTKPAPAALTK
jgi:LemA protein